MKALRAAAAASVMVCLLLVLFLSSSDGGGAASGLLVLLGSAPSTPDLAQLLASSVQWISQRGAKLSETCYAVPETTQIGLTTYVLPSSSWSTKTATSKARQCAPWFFVIGAFKGGTTSMYSYLSQHPSVATLPTDTTTLEQEQMSAATLFRRTAVRTKETGFFQAFDSNASVPLVGALKVFAEMEENAVKIGQLRTEQVHRQSGRPDRSASLQDYMNVYFPTFSSEEGLVTGEASPSYLYDSSVPPKLLRMFPHARMLVLLREPVERAYSRVAHQLSLICTNYKVTQHRKHCTPQGAAAVFEHTLKRQLPGVEKCVERFRAGSGGASEKPATNLQQGLPEADRRYSRLVGCLRSNVRKTLRMQISDLDLALKVYKSNATALTKIVVDSNAIKQVLNMDVFGHSLYVFQLHNWLRFFPSQQMLLLQSEFFFSQPAAAMKAVEHFLGLSPGLNWTQVVGTKYNVRVVNSSSSSTRGGKSSGRAEDVQKVLEQTTQKQIKHNLKHKKMVASLVAEPAGRTQHHLRALLSPSSLAALNKVFSPLNQELFSVLHDMQRESGGLVVLPTADGWQNWGDTSL